MNKLIALINNYNTLSDEKGRILGKKAGCGIGADHYTGHDDGDGFGDPGLGEGNGWGCPANCLGGGWGVGNGWGDGDGLGRRDGYGSDGYHRFMDNCRWDD